MNVGVGKYIYEALTANHPGIEISPVVIPPNPDDPTGSQLTYIVYRRTGCSPEYTKDLFTGNIEHYYTLLIADSDFTNAVNIAEQVINTMLAISYKEFPDMKFKQVKLVDLQDDFIDGIYTQTLQFEINTSSK